jgi:hypothetical protein
MRPAHRFARRATLVARATLLAVGVGIGGCATPAPTIPSRAASRPARVELVNLSDCDWRVSLTLAGGQAPRTVLLPARETARLEVAGGDYVITQTALSGLAETEASRRFETHLEYGEGYRWRLVTLFSATSAPAP